MDERISFALYVAATVTLLICLIGMPLGWFGQVPVWASVLAIIGACAIVGTVIYVIVQAIFVAMVLGMLLDILFDSIFS
jgi:hypothetical protein